MLIRRVRRPSAPTVNRRSTTVRSGGLPQASVGLATAPDPFYACQDEGLPQQPLNPNGRWHPPRQADGSSGWRATIPHQSFLPKMVDGKDEQCLHSRP
nr:unnamed protein product [Digitaria exilis]